MEVNKIIPELEEDYANMGRCLQMRIENYIELFGTECLEELLNALFKEMQIKKIKIKLNYKMSKKTISQTISVTKGK